ncbi:hypothetical protein [Barnesiella intestinihominis]|jgi:hypothetical protein|uniref:hypothetical protein n=1 Tax=Barnesiella intestinihominis TaxID=487174 RepID=UPI003AF09D3B
MKKKTKTDRIVKTVLGGAAGGAITQVVKGTIMKGKNSLYTDLGAIAIGAVLPALVKMDGIDELGAGMIGAGAAGVIASSVPSLSGLNLALSGNQTDYRRRLISGPRSQKKSSPMS